MWSVPLSFGLTTMLAVMVAKFASLNLACFAVMALGVTSGAMIAVELVRRGKFRLGRIGWMVAGAGLLLTLFVVGELVDIGFGNKLYMSVTVYDHALRAAFVDAVVRTGVPPANPVYMTAPRHADAMRYYYFWYVVCAVVVKVFGVSGRMAMVASCVWSGFGLAAVISLYCRYFLRPADGVGGPRRRIWITVGLLAVTGLDIIPVLATYLQGAPVDPDMEWWTPDQVSSWLDTKLWVPHHLAALVCLVFGFLLVWMSAKLRWRDKILCGVIAGVGFAASFGLSTYVSVAFGILMVLWLLWSLGWAEGRSRCPGLVLAGVVAVVLLVPYLHELQAESGGGDAKTHLFAFGFRRMLDPELLSGAPGFKQMRARNLPEETAMAMLALIVPGYAAELGFFAVVFLLVLRRMRDAGDAERTAVFLIVNGLVISTFMRSAVIANNDFGIRSMLIPQFFLLLLGGLLLDGTMKVSRRWVRVMLGISIAVGLAGTAYQAILLRLYLPTQDRQGRQNLGGISERNMALREIRQGIERHTPAGAVLQFNPVQPKYFFNFSQLLNTPRQIVNMSPECAVGFGGDANQCARINQELAHLYMESSDSSAAAGESAVDARIPAGGWVLMH